ncbi:hypothetical protein [Chitinophaga defluvii]|uniref:Tetratricopeptide repeat protein n=1 Tax=Chitinophaga defluvii TaxID=3163343 RepID=A0ABV2T7S2_9BACT
MTANRIIDHIFQQPDLPQVDQAALAKLVGDYPYFTAGRLLLAQKDYSIHQNMHSAAIKKAMLYSNNPHYVYQFIIGELEKVEEPNDPTLPDTPTAATPVTAAVAATEADPAEAETLTTPAAETTAAIKADTVAGEATNIASVDAAGTITAGAAQPVEAATPAPSVEQPAVAAATEDMTTPVAVAHDNEVLQPAYPEDTPDQDEPIKIFPLDIPAEETTLTFQPLYTDDYFAYKRLKEPARADDLNEKGMAEMKSFTDWLRQMKDSFAGKAQKDWYHQHLHHIYEDEEPEVSEAVEQMAMKSITLNDDIVSETLAEIWARQHQYQSAIHIYQKLSLLNPDKSAYFAQKIAELHQLEKDKINSNKH